MWQQNVAKVLTHLGWGSGFRLPIANEENLALERELEKKQKLVQEKQEELEDTIKHSKILEDRIKSVSDHIAHENKLQSAKRTEMLAEQELLRFVNREMEKTVLDVKLMKDNFRKARQRNWTLCKEIDERKRDLSELVQLIEYDKLELVRLEKISEGQDVYLKMLEQLCENDAEGLKKYESMYSAAAEAVVAARGELDNEASLTRVAQHELEGLSDRFRKLHKERGEIVGLWKNTLVSLATRDAEMKYIAETYTEVHAKFKTSDLKLECQRSKLEEQQRTAGNADIQLNRWDRKVGEIREEIKTANELSESLRDSVIGFEVNISLCSKQIQSLNKNCKDIDEEIAGMDYKIAQASARIEDLRERFECIQMQAVTAAERMKQIATIVDEEEKKLEVLGKQMEKEMIRKSRWSEKKKTLTDKTMNIDHKIRGNETTLMLLIDKSKKNNFVLDERNSTIYKIEIEGISLDIKIKPLLNPKLFDSERYSENEEKILELKKILKDTIHNRNFVTNQTGHLDDVNRRIYHEKLAFIKCLEKLKNQSDEHRVYVNFSTKSLKQMEDEHNNLFVDQSLIKLKLTHMLKAVKEQKDILYDTEYQRLLLQSAAKEKRSEIDFHSKLLEIKRRGLRDELIPMKIQLTQVIDTVNKKRKRYEIVMRLMAKTSENAEDIKSEAYYVLKMAQERQLLQREGDLWDTRVKEAEKECEALQNTLSLMKCENDMFKDSLKPILTDEGYESEMKELEQKKKEFMARKTKAMKGLCQLEQEISQKLREIESAKQQKTNYENIAMDKQYEFGVLQSDLNNQAISVKRAQTLGIKLVQKLNFSGNEEKAVVSLDLKLRITQRKLEFALQALARLLNLYPEMLSLIGRILCEQFGQDIAFKFLKRVSPYGDCIPSPTNSATSTKGHGSIKKRGKSSPSGSVSTKVTPYRNSSRTESNQRLLRGVVSAVEKSRSVLLSQRQQDIDRQEQLSASNETTDVSKSIQTSDNNKRTDVDDQPKDSFLELDVNEGHSANTEE